MKDFEFKGDELEEIAKRLGEEVGADISGDVDSLVSMNGESRLQLGEEYSAELKLEWYHDYGLIEIKGENLQFRLSRKQGEEQKAVLRLDLLGESKRDLLYCALDQTLYTIGRLERGENTIRSAGNFERPNPIEWSVNEPFR